MWAGVVVVALIVGIAGLCAVTIASDPVASEESQSRQIAIWAAVSRLSADDQEVLLLVSRRLLAVRRKPCETVTMGDSDKRHEYLEQACDGVVHLLRALVRERSA